MSQSFFITPQLNSFAIVSTITALDNPTADPCSSKKNFKDHKIVEGQSQVHVKL